MSSAAHEKLLAKSERLVRLFVSICSHKWPSVPELGRQCLESGATLPELLGCIRHVVVVAGYPPSLAAAKKLHAAGVIKEPLPGKAGGQPGNAFDLVYATKTDKVWQNLYAIDPVLSEWIRCHCYGDIYSNPGLDLRQKQLMTSAFLAEADMHDEFFGHVIAGLRFGNSLGEILQSVEIAFDVAGSRSSKEEVFSHATKLALKAAHKVAKDFPHGPPAMPEVLCPDPKSIRIPPLPPPLDRVYFQDS